MVEVTYTPLSFPDCFSSQLVLILFQPLVTGWFLMIFSSLSSDSSTLVSQTLIACVLVNLKFTQPQSLSQIVIPYILTLPITTLPPYPQFQASLISTFCLLSPLHLSTLTHNSLILLGTFSPLNLLNFHSNRFLKCHQFLPYPDWIPHSNVTMQMSSTL